MVVRPRGGGRGEAPVRQKHSLLACTAGRLGLQDSSALCAASQSRPSRVAGRRQRTGTQRHARGDLDTGRRPRYGGSDLPIWCRRVPRLRQFLGETVLATEPTGV